MSKSHTRLLLLYIIVAGVFVSGCHPSQEPTYNLFTGIRVAELARKMTAFDKKVVNTDTFSYGAQNMLIHQFADSTFMVAYVWDMQNPAFDPQKDTNAIVYKIAILDKDKRTRYSLHADPCVLIQDLNLDEFVGKKFSELTWHLPYMETHTLPANEELYIDGRMYYGKAVIHVVVAGESVMDVRLECPPFPHINEDYCEMQKCLSEGVILNIVSNCGSK